MVDGRTLAGLGGRERRHSVQVDDDAFLVPAGPPEPADHVNHSCEPNAGMRGQITLVAMRPIAAGEEIVMDYAMTDASPFWEFDCLCGASACRGRVTGDDWRRPDLQRKYAEYFSPYLRDRIRQHPTR